MDSAVGHGEARGGCGIPKSALDTPELWHHDRASSCQDRSGRRGCSRRPIADSRGATGKALGIHAPRGHQANKDVAEPHVSTPPVGVGRSSIGSIPRMLREAGSAKESCRFLAKEKTTIGDRLRGYCRRSYPVLHFSFSCRSAAGPSLAHL